MRTPNGDLILVLPGILGSRLCRGEREIWGFGRVVRSLSRLSSTLTEDLSLDASAYLDHERGCDDGTSSDGVLRSAPRLPVRSHGRRLSAPLATAIPGFLSVIDGYDLLLARLVRTFDVRDIVAFPYDWRQSSRVSARTLKRLVEPLMRERRRLHRSCQLIMIGHSMGGLVARYYAECLDTNRYTGRVVTIGTPFQGALKALSALANDRIRLAAGPLAVTVDLGELLRTLPSVAEMLPSYPCLGTDVDSLVALGPDTSVPGLPDHIRDHGLNFHREIASAVVANGVDRPVYSPILCSRQPTDLWATIGKEGIETRRSDGPQGGDGTVARLSATPPEWVDRGAGMFVNGRHAGLHQAPGTWEQLLGLLTGSAPARTMSEAEELVVDAQEYVALNGRWTVEVKAASGNQHLALVVEVANAGSIVARAPLRPCEGRYTATIELSAPGICRWEVRANPMGNSRVGVVCDMLVCADP
jgi:pimeloyl-ACP methyl ester carboxylesterase